MGFLNSFLFNHLRFQIAATAVLVVVEILYFSRPKLRILSAKIFNCIMISAAIYLAFDYATVFSLVYYDDFPKWLVRLLHQGFIFSFEATFLFIYIFLDVVSRNQRRLSLLETVFTWSVCFISIVIVSFAHIHYSITPDNVYSYGPMVDYVYLIITVLTLSTLFKAGRGFRQVETKRVSSYVIFTMWLWIVFGITQLFIPQILISSVSISTMLVVLLLSLGNPAEFVDKESGAFNYDALKLVIADKFYSKKPFYIVNIDMDEISKLRKQTGDQGVIKMLTQVRQFVTDNFKQNVFQLNHHSLTLVFDSKNEKDIEKDFRILYDRFHEQWVLNEHTKIHLNAHIDYVRYPKDTPFIDPEDPSATSQLLEFVELCHTYSDEADFVHRVDNKLLQNRTRQDTIFKILQEAIRTDGIEMYYQPIWNVKEQSFSNCEALVRLKDDKTLGFISPEEFIPVAERNFLIMPLSYKIFEEVFKFMSGKKLYERGLKHMEINLSAIESVDIGFPAIMKELLEKYQIEPSTLNLEITESIAISSGRRLKRNMQDLISHGCSFSMDDFGTGYSNLSQLTRADFSIIKVDKSLLWPVFEKKNPNKENSQILLENMIMMIKKMGLKIVVEGVETKDQLDYLCNLGVDYIQGYYFSKPINEADYLAFLESNMSKK